MMRSCFGWDGVLPLAAGCAPLLVKLLLPRRHIAEVVATLIIPMFAALVRSTIGYRQITHVCGGRAPLGRQLALAAAIVLLLGFEFLAGALTFEKNAAGAIWPWLAGVYFAYLVAIRLALRPRSGGSSDETSSQ